MQEKGGYSDEQWASIGSRIVAAANKLLGGGYSLKDGKIATPSNHPELTEDDDENEDSRPVDGAGENCPGPNDDVDGSDYNEPPTHKNNPKGATKMNEQPKGAVVTLEEFNKMSTRLAEVERENRRMKLSEKVDSLIYDKEAKVGHLAPAQRESVLAFMETLTDEQVAKFEEVISKSPAVISYGEKGISGSTEGTVDRSVMLAEKAVAYMKKS